MHGLQHSGGARLQRNMKMPRDAIGRNHQIYKILGNILRLDGAETQLIESSFVQNAPNYVNQSGSRREIPAVSTQVDTAQHDLLCSGTDQLAHLFHHDIRRQAAATAADKRDHAVGATVVASILNFQDGARAIAGYSILRRDLNGSLRENISGEDLGRSSFQRHGVGVEL